MENRKPNVSIPFQDSKPKKAEVFVHTGTTSVATTPDTLEKQSKQRPQKR
jgi:hypothetical protein